MRNMTHKTRMGEYFLKAHLKNNGSLTLKITAIIKLNRNTER